jgi:hypothetical protein
MQGADSAHAENTLFGSIERKTAQDFFHSAPQSSGQSAASV